MCVLSCIDLQKGPTVKDEEDTNFDIKNEPFFQRIITSCSYHTLALCMNKGDQVEYEKEK